MLVVEGLARAIADQDVRHAFVLLGSANVRVAHYLTADHGVALHQARHESGAVAAADGYARATGNVGFCSATCGPGFTNTLTPLMTAAKANTPLVLLTGSTVGVPGRERPFAFVQAVDPVRVLDALGVASQLLRPETLHSDVEAAFRRAHDNLEPVVLVLPAQCEDESVGDTSSVSRPVGRPSPDGDMIDRAVDLLLAAQRPLVLAGHGAFRAGVGEGLADLANHTGALVATTLRGWGLFGEDPFSMGILGGFGAPPAADIAARADTVLAVGASLNDFTTKKGALVDGTVLIQCDIDAAAVGRHTDVDLSLVGDASEVVERLLHGVRERGPARIGWRTAGVLDDVHAYSTDDEFDDESVDGWMDPRALCVALEHILPSQRAIATDGGHFALFPITHMSIPDPSGLIWTLDFGATGGGLGAAIGAAVGRPDRLTVLFIGDGGFLMTLGDLDDAVRDRVPLLIIVMNNESYASEVSILEQFGLPTHHSIFETPSLAEIAHAIGARAQTISSLADLDALPEWLADLDGPLVLDCRVLRIRPRALSSL